MKNKIIIAGTVLTLTLSGFGYVGSVNAEVSVDEKKEDVSQKLNGVETDILNATKKINEINLDISSLESAVKVNQEEITRVTKEAKTYESEIKELEKEITSLEEEIEARNEILKERLSSYQNDGGDVGFMEVIFGSTGFEEFITRFTAVTTITKADNDLVEKQKSAINKVEEKETQLKEKLTATEKNKKELTEINKNQKNQKKELTESKKSVESKVSDLKVKKSAYIAEGNDLEALEEQIEEEIKATEVGLSEATETRTSENTNTDTVEEESTQSDENEEPTSNEQTEETSSNTNNSTEETASSNSSNNTEETASSNSNNRATEESATSSQSSASQNNQPEPERQATDNNKSKPKPKKSPAKSSSGNGIISDAHALSGTKYNGNGGTQPSTGFDCSGFTTFVYEKNGINLPRSAAAQYAAYPKVSKSQLRAGDLVFFSTTPGGSSITHVGISLGGTQYIGSQSSTGVAVSSINEPYYWGPRYVGGARPN